LAVVRRLLTAFQITPLRACQAPVDVSEANGGNHVIQIDSDNGARSPGLGRHSCGTTPNIVYT
jgi:hypothetical protein